MLAVTVSSSILTVSCFNVVTGLSVIFQERGKNVPSNRDFHHACLDHVTDKMTK